MSEFFQDPPRLYNTYGGNRWLRAYLKHKLAPEMRAIVDEDLHGLGARCAGPYLELARRAERERPEHVPYDPWGKRIDEIRVSPAWSEMKDVAAGEQLVSLAYRREYHEYSRIYQFAKLYLFHPSSAFFTCPLAMADGAAKVLEVHGTLPEHKEAFLRLTSPHADENWTAGQWMTERTGGSDVSRTSTVARGEDGRARLYGTKWFSSATTSEIALALARFEGSEALSLFMVPLRVNGALNSLSVLRLKDKLGTHALPTAELRLEGAFAYPLGESERGIKTVATMLNVTRLYNSICSVAQATRALDEMRAYSARREVFGAPLEQHPMHYGTFALEEVKTLAGFLVTMELAHLLGREECGTSSAHDAATLRLMTPVAKLFTARAAVQTASEVVEGFGGAGYVEDTGIPQHLRDAQVFPIWEGATNVLALDMLRVLQKTGAVAMFKEDVAHRLKSVRAPELGLIRDQIMTKVQSLELRLGAWAKSAPPDQVASGRDLAFHVGWLFASVLALVWAESESGENRRQLLHWVTQILKSAGDWKPKDADEIQRLREIWQTSLKV